jgi:putative DNA methylase
MISKKKLIEVALPLVAINTASAREKSIRQGHPSTLHLWWARRPLAAARAVIFAQMVNDPSNYPGRFPTEEAQEKERQRLFRLIEELVLWENITNEKVLDQAREEIWKSWRATCTENKNDPRAKKLFDPQKLPPFHDPFAGGGSLPLEGQRLGLESYASDLNPVAVLINKAMIEIPPKFAGRPPINPAVNKDKSLIKREWRRTQGLADDVRYYGQWMRNEAEKRIGHLYPTVEVTAKMAKECPNLKPYVDEKLTVIAWLWARTVKSPNPAFATVDVPLASTFMLSTKIGKEAHVEPVVEGDRYRFTVKVGKPKNAEAAKNGTKLARGANFRCLMSGTPIASEYIYSEANAGRMGARLMVIVAEGKRGRVYIAPTLEAEAIAGRAQPRWKPELAMPENPRWFSPPLYGLKTYGDLFTPRQLVALTTFSELAAEARERVKRDALHAGLTDDGITLDAGGTGATAYADAVATYLAATISKVADRSSSICGWDSSRDSTRNTFGRQAIPMVWDFAEANVIGDSSGSLTNAVDQIARTLLTLPGVNAGSASQADASVQTISNAKVVSTDPPYYDNIGYADLSDFFYVWLRRSLKLVFPDLFATLPVPKVEELVATPYRHGSKEKAEAFFLDGMTEAMHRLASQAHPAFPVTIYYAFKQSETDASDGTASTGWETFLDAVIRAGFALTGTWPMRTELGNRMVGMDTNALASSIILVCRPRTANAPIATRREFVTALKAELPVALAHLQRGNIAPWTWRRRPSVPAWQSTRVTQKSSTRRVNRSPYVKPWPLSTTPLTRRWRSRRVISMPTAAGRWRGWSNQASRRARTAWRRRFPRPRTPALPAWWRQAFSPQRVERSACSVPTSYRQTGTQKPTLA